MDVQLMTYSAEEKETIYLYDYLDKVWKCETNVPTHMTQAIKRFPHLVEVLTYMETKDGLKPSKIKFKLPKNGVSIRKQKDENSDIEENDDLDSAE